MRYPGTTKWNGRTHDDLEKLLHISLSYQTNASLPLYASASSTRQGIVTMLRLGSGGSQFYILETLLEMQTLTNHGVLCSCPCDKYSYA